MVNNWLQVYSTWGKNVKVTFPSHIILDIKEIYGAGVFEGNFENPNTDLHVPPSPEKPLT